jgi:hypothetical protein
MAMSMKTAFWYIEQYSLVNADQHFKCAYCLHHQGDEAGLVMEVVRTSETLVYFNETTYHYIPESCHFH